MDNYFLYKDIFYWKSRIGNKRNSESNYFQSIKMPFLFEKASESYRAIVAKIA